MDDVKRPNLLPCPFCGGEADIEARTSDTIPSVPCALVFCKKCNASTQWFCGRDGSGDFMFEAIEAWNRRVVKCQFSIGLISENEEG